MTASLEYINLFNAISWVAHKALFCHITIATNFCSDINNNMNIVEWCIYIGNL